MDRDGNNKFEWGNQTQKDKHDEFFLICRCQIWIFRYVCLNWNIHRSQDTFEERGRIYVEGDKVQAVWRGKRENSI